MTDHQLKSFAFHLKNLCLMLELKRPLIFVDVESTGLDPQTDRIVELALYKVRSFASPLTGPRNGDHLTLFIDPEQPIPAITSRIHGITAESLLAAGAMPFRYHAETILEFIEGCDLAGFNSNHFDVPILANEFTRAAVYWDTSDVQLVDIGNIFKIKNSRSLSSAVSYYCGHEHVNAHSAIGDALATLEVFIAQLARHPDLPTDVAGLAQFANYGNRRADVQGKFYYRAGDGVLCFGFGKHKGQPARDHPGVDAG